MFGPDIGLLQNNMVLCIHSFMGLIMRLISCIIITPVGKVLHYNKHNKEML